MLYYLGWLVVAKGGDGVGRVCHLIWPACTQSPGRGGWERGGGGGRRLLGLLWMRGVLTEFHLCHGCSCQEIEGRPLQAGLRVVGVGSYRRGKTASGDIDILFSHTDGSSHVGKMQALRCVAQYDPSWAAVICTATH
jgi:hypothetical protein